MKITNNQIIISRKTLLKLSCCLVLLLCVSAIGHAQTIVRGKIINSEDGIPLPGATILVKGTTNGAVSDFDGEYTINVSDKAETLLFSYISYEPQEIKINGQTIINVAMVPDAGVLEEVIVIGYGTRKKKEIAGAVAQVKVQDIEQYVTPDVTSTLQGQVAGVSVTSNSGEPGAQSSIQIRGITTLQGSNEPLYVIDGIPQELGYQLTLASNEIQTFDILKDGASAAIYGTRGAAGVILITTKRGKVGKMAITFNHSYGIQRLGQNIPLMNTEQQLFYETQQANTTLITQGSSAFEAGPTRPEWLTNENDLRDLVLVNNPVNEVYNLGVSGGVKGFTYSVNGGYSNTQGVLIGSSFKRYNARASTSYKSDHWKINTSIGFVLDDRQRAANSLLTNAIRYKPYFPSVDNTSDQFFTDSDNGGVNTPLVALSQGLRQRDNTRTDRINTSLSITRDLTKNLSVTSRIGTNVNNTIRNVFMPRIELIDIQDGTVEVDPTRNGVTAIASRLNVFSWDGRLNYKNSFGDHTFDAMLAATFDERTFQRFLAARNGVENNDVEVLDGATLNQRADSGGDNFVGKNIGFLGRLQYDYKGKYIVQGIIRRDGSSKFGNRRWGNFPSIQLAWNVSDENFWQSMLPSVNNFKIRLSRGTIGNDSFNSYYAFQDVIAREQDYIFDENDGNITFGSSVISFPNQDIKWETTISKNIGIDIGVLKNKINITADYYQSDKEDMIFPIRLPGSSGVAVVNDNSSVIQFRNIGNMTNKGFELGINYREKIGKSKLNISTTFSKNTNKITKITDGFDRINNEDSNVLAGARGGNSSTVFQVGREAGAFFLFETGGVVQTEEQLLAYQEINPNAALGDLIYVDQITEDTNGDGIPDTANGRIGDEDRKYSGSSLPDFEIGFNLRWTYKNFDVGMNWFASVGSEIINATKADAFARGRHRDLVNMWTFENPTSNIPLLVNIAPRHPNYAGNTDLWLEKGDYLRLKLVTLGYTIPRDVSDKIGINKLRFYVSAQNPITITNYDGYDPEIGGNTISRRGIDASRFPITSLYSLGLNLKF